MLHGSPKNHALEDDHIYNYLGYSSGSLGSAMKARAADRAGLEVLLHDARLGD